MVESEHVKRLQKALCFLEEKLVMVFGMLQKHTKTSSVRLAPHTHTHDYTVGNGMKCFRMLVEHPRLSLLMAVLGSLCSAHVAGLRQKKR